MTMTIINICFMCQPIKNVQCNEHSIQPLNWASFKLLKLTQIINMSTAFFIETIKIQPQH